MQNPSRIRLRSGLTTIELIVVMAVVGFLFSITMVSLKNFIIPASQDTAQELQASLRFAYNHSLLNHKTVILEFDFETQEYQTFRVEREDDGIREESILRRTKLPFNNQIFSAVDLGGREIREGKIRIPYAHDGSSWDITLLMGEEGNVKKSIQIFRYGGRVIIRNGEDIRIASRELEKVDYGVDEREEEDESERMNRY